MDLNNQTIQNQLAHRTVRDYQDKPVPDDVVKTLLNVANRTANSSNMQSYSIIRVTDPEQKAVISKITTQAFVAHLPEMWIFVVDLCRNSHIAKEQGCMLESVSDMESFFQGFTDCCLSAQNVMVTVESLGMGGIFFAGVLNDIGALIEILQLPPQTFPVLGVGFGFPKQLMDLKPRMDISLKSFENTYKVYDEYLPAVRGYDEVMKDYYATRTGKQRPETFSHLVVRRLENAREKRSLILRYAEKQGFNLKVRD